MLYPLRVSGETSNSCRRSNRPGNSQAKRTGIDCILWRETLERFAEGITISGKGTEGAFMGVFFARLKRMPVKKYKTGKRKVSFE